jgi:hypothetical protein
MAAAGGKPGGKLGRLALEAVQRAGRISEGCDPVERSLCLET